MAPLKSASRQKKAALTPPPGKRSRQPKTAPVGAIIRWPPDEDRVEEIFVRLSGVMPDPKTELDFVNPYTLVVAVALSAQATDVGVNKATKALFAIADPVKESTPAALEALRAEGIDVVMLTGDNQVTANAVARSLGIKRVEAEVLPDHKSDVVKNLREAGRVVAMAGDGINDAPALAAADVGIAMGSGTDVAMESAGITLLRGDLTGITKARHLSEMTMSNIRQNLVFAFIYNAAGIPIAAGVLYPVLGLLLSPILAAAAMALSSVSVIANALRLRARTID
mgnify:CR=1 FL=1